MVFFDEFLARPFVAVAWVAVGLIPGFLAAQGRRGGGYGPADNAGVLLAGAVAAVAGGLLCQGVSHMDGVTDLGFVGSLLAAALAATAVVWCLKSPAPVNNYVAL